MSYRVVVNHEEQYSIWPAGQDLPDGWRADGFSGGKEDCLAHIDKVWTDMRPLGARNTGAEAVTGPAPEVTGV
ncbi:MbtH family NRPS accessory protein [Streptosporangium sp. 'caverna']|uniref:MbtH family protein n=1 Tax=Streptosporangium sp. 'caverna' TaxID=2202249 RepID=UPI000D7DECDA|nr:MbtH family NRPS accessory protein [Streptosporangium sp. 'caverna']AWS41455.1 antibiotic synthesis protein MbtH [Streptosporangium sp. 'caverna']